MLMNPLSALIGGASSIIGGLMSSSSAAAANAANLDFANWKASGGNLPGLVANAKAAGISPLAALGINTTSSAAQVGTDPGAGLMRAGSDIAKIDPMQQQQNEADLQIKKTQLQSLAGDVTQKNINNQILMESLARVRAHGGWVTPGWGEPSADTGLIPNILQGAQREAKNFRDWIPTLAPSVSAFGKRFGNWGNPWPFDNASPSRLF